MTLDYACFSVPTDTTGLAEAPDGFCKRSPLHRLTSRHHEGCPAGLPSLRVRTDGRIRRLDDVMHPIQSLRRAPANTWSVGAADVDGGSCPPR